MKDSHVSQEPVDWTSLEKMCDMRARAIDGIDRLRSVSYFFSPYKTNVLSARDMERNARDLLEPIKGLVIWFCIGRERQRFPLVF